MPSKQQAPCMPSTTPSAFGGLSRRFVCGGYSRGSLAYGVMFGGSVSATGPAQHKQRAGGWPTLKWITDGQNHRWHDRDAYHLLAYIGGHEKQPITQTSTMPAMAWLKLSLKMISPLTQLRASTFTQPNINIVMSGAQSSTSWISIWNHTTLQYSKTYEILTHNNTPHIVLSKDAQETSWHILLPYSVPLSDYAMNFKYQVRLYTCNY